MMVLSRATTKVESVKPMVIVAAGASHVREVTPPGQLEGVLRAYDEAVTSAFILSIACSGIATCLSLLFEWKSVKGKKLELGGA